MDTLRSQPDGARHPAASRWAAWPALPQALPRTPHTTKPREEAKEPQTRRTLLAPHCITLNVNHGTIVVLWRSLRTPERLAALHAVTAPSANPTGG